MWFTAHKWKIKVYVTMKEVGFPSMRWFLILLYEPLWAGSSRTYMLKRGQSVFKSSKLFTQSPKRKSMWVKPGEKIHFLTSNSTTTKTLKKQNKEAADFHFSYPSVFAFSISCHMFIVKRRIFGMRFCFPESPQPHILLEFMSTSSDVPLGWNEFGCLDKKDGSRHAKRKDSFPGVFQ